MTQRDRAVLAGDNCHRVSGGDGCGARRAVMFEQCSSGSVPAGDAASEGQQQDGVCGKDPGRERSRRGRAAKGCEGLSSLGRWGVTGQPVFRRACMRWAPEAGRPVEVAGLTVAPGQDVI